MITISYVHNRTVKLLLNQLIWKESFLEYRIFSTDVCCALPIETLELIVLSPEDLFFLAMGLYFKLEIFHLLEVIFVKMRYTLEFIGSAEDCKL
jgi:hypothetical protein